MNVVVWTSAGQHYATATEQVVEVVPVVEVRPLPKSPAWMLGLMNYRSRLIPLLDASALLGHGATECRMASRILVLRRGDSPRDEQPLIGLLVGELLGSQEMSFSDRSGHPGPKPEAADFLGPVALTDTGTVQLTEAKNLVLST